MDGCGSTLCEEYGWVRGKEIEVRESDVHL